MLYTPYTLPLITSFSFPGDGPLIYIPTYPTQADFYYIIWNESTAQWDEQPGSTEVVQVDPASLTAIPLLSTPATLDIGIALTSTFNPWFLVVDLVHAGILYSYQQSPITLPPQPPPQPESKPFPYTRLHRYTPPIRRGPGRSLWRPK